MKYTIVNYVDCSKKQIEDIYRMRNLPEIRKYSYNTKEIEFEQHMNFIESLKGDKQRIYYAVYKNDDLIGCYNLQLKSNDIWERGIFATPQYQGKGETYCWENQILSGLDKSLFRIIEARIKEDNIPSIKYHEKSGFIKIGYEDGYLIYMKQL